MQLPAATMVLLVVVAAAALAPTYPSTASAAVMVEAAATTWLDCGAIAQLARSEPFARGAIKAVEWATLADGTRVVVARPHDKALKRFQLAVQHAMSPERAVYKAQLRYAELWRADRELLLSLRDGNGSSFVPHLYGGCWDAYESLALVLEPLRNGIDVLLDDSLSLRQRTRLALSSLALLAHLRAVPLPPDGARHACVYGDVHAQQFGVAADYAVKLLDVDAKDFHCVAAPGRRLDDDVECNTLDGCFKHFTGERQMFGRLWEATLGGVGQSRQFPSEFACNINTHRCHGLDGAANLYALCNMWLRHLLVTVPEQAADAALHEPFLADARKLITECSRHSVERRFTEPELRWALERLEHTHFPNATAASLPPLPLEPRLDFNKAKRDFLRLEIPPRANATELALQNDALQQENDMLRARIRQLEREVVRLKAGG